MLTAPPSWALALTYWLHMFATVAWVGSLAAVALLILPAMQRTLDAENQLLFIEAMQRRLEPIAWFSMSVLLATGLFQMSVNPHYDGLLSVSTQWSLAILSTHLLGIVLCPFPCHKSLCAAHEYLRPDTDRAVVGVVQKGRQFA